jgi:hypothetical protein
MKAVLMLVAAVAVLGGCGSSSPLKASIRFHEANNHDHLARDGSVTVSCTSSH